LYVGEIQERLSIASAQSTDPLHRWHPRRRWRQVEGPWAQRGELPAIHRRSDHGARDRRSRAGSVVHCPPRVAPPIAARTTGET